MCNRAIIENHCPVCHAMPYERCRPTCPCQIKIISIPNSPNSKPSNPKDAVGIRKVPMSTVPAPVIMEVGLAMLEGARKYGRHNYRAVGVRASVYYDAAMRHLNSFWEGENIDPGSGIHHLSKAMACFAVLRDCIMRGNWVDDRPPKTEDGWIEKLNILAGEIIDRYPNALPPYTELDLDHAVVKAKANFTPATQPQPKDQSKIQCPKCAAEEAEDEFSTAFEEFTKDETMAILEANDRIRRNREYVFIAKHTHLLLDIVRAQNIAVQSYVYEIFGAPLSLIV